MVKVLVFNTPCLQGQMVRTSPREGRGCTLLMIGKTVKQLSSVSLVFTDCCHLDKVRRIQCISNSDYSQVAVTYLFDKLSNDNIQVCTPCARCTYPVMHVRCTVLLQQPVLPSTGWRCNGMSMTSIRFLFTMVEILVLKDVIAKLTIYKR